MGDGWGVPHITAPAFVGGHNWPVDDPWRYLGAALSARRAALHNDLRDAVESEVADFRFTDPAAEERAFQLREAIIDAEIATLSSGDVPPLRFMVDLGRAVGHTRLPLEHHFTAHRAAYPLLLDAALEAARAWPPDDVAELVRRHNQYATATTEAFVEGYVESREADVVDNPRAARRFLDEILTTRGGWTASATRQAATLGMTEHTPCCVVAGSWASLGTLRTDALARRLSAWLAMVPAPNLLVADHHVDGVVLGGDGVARVVDTLRAAVDALRSDGVVGLRVGVSSILEAGQGLELAREARLAHDATTEHRPVVDAANLGVLEYLVAVGGVNAAHLVPEGVRNLHRVADRNSPSAREVLAQWHDLDGDLRGVAARLHCHPNTILNRLRTVAETSGFDPRTPRGILTLLVGLATLDHASVPGGHGGGLPPVPLGHA